VAGSGEIEHGVASNTAACIIDLHYQRVGVLLRTAGNVAQVHIDRGIGADRSTTAPAAVVVVIDIEFRASWGGGVTGNAHVDECASADRTSAAPDRVVIVIVKIL